MKKYVMLLWGLMIAGGWFASCSSDHDDVPSEAAGKSGIRIGLNTDTGFESRAVDESYYKNKDNYMVQILKDGIALKDYNNVMYSEVKGKELLLEGGSYTVKAFKGEDKAVFEDGLYVVGTKDFTVANGIVPVEVECAPTSAKVVVSFKSADLDKYFSDYYVIFETKALSPATYTWKKEHAATDPVYLKVDKEETVKGSIYFTAKEGVKAPATMVWSGVLSPLQMKTITVGTNMSEGSLGITITIDETVIDKNISIEVPSDWV